MPSAASLLVPQSAWDALHALYERLDGVSDTPALLVRSGIRTVDTDVRPSGTMRAWMEAQNGALIHTVQIGHNSGDVWTPVWRMVNAEASTYVLLAGSRRDYAGMTVVFSTPTILLVTSEHHTILYVTA